VEAVAWHPVCGVKSIKWAVVRVDIAKGALKTVIHLLREFGTLPEAKLKKGKLSPKSEKRFQELKKFYDSLMDENGVSQGSVTWRYAASELREQLQRREHLRVPMAVDIVFEHDGEFLSGRVANLSSAGVFLTSDTILEAGSELTLYLGNIGRGSDGVMTIEGEVVWHRKEGESDDPAGMGIHFLNVPEDIQRHLDSFVLETLEKHLCALSPGALDPEFLDREKIKL
jgi:uncharacterized protein (TIGR02266 family)